MLNLLLDFLRQLGDFLEKHLRIILRPWLILFLLIIDNLLGHSILLNSFAFRVKPIPEPADGAREHLSLAPVSEHIVFGCWHMFELQSMFVGKMVRFV